MPKKSKENHVESSELQPQEERQNAQGQEEKMSLYRNRTTTLERLSHALIDKVNPAYARRLREERIQQLELAEFFEHAEGEKEEIARQQNPVFVPEKSYFAAVVEPIVFLLGQVLPQQRFPTPFLPSSQAVERAGGESSVLAAPANSSLALAKPSFGQGMLAMAASQIGGALHTLAAAIPVWPPVVGATAVVEAIDQEQETLGHSAWDLVFSDSAIYKQLGSKGKKYLYDLVTPYINETCKERNIALTKEAYMAILTEYRSSKVVGSSRKIDFFFKIAHGIEKNYEDIRIPPSHYGLAQKRFLKTLEFIVNHWQEALNQNKTLLIAVGELHTRKIPSYSLIQHLINYPSLNIGGFFKEGLTPQQNLNNQLKKLQVIKTYNLPLLNLPICMGLSSSYESCFEEFCQEHHVEDIPLDHDLYPKGQNKTMRLRHWQHVLTSTIKVDKNYIVQWGLAHHSDFINQDMGHIYPIYLIPYRHQETLFALDDRILLNDPVHLQSHKQIFAFLTQSPPSPYVHFNAFFSRKGTLLDLTEEEGQRKSYGLNNTALFLEDSAHPKELPLALTQKMEQLKKQQQEMAKEGEEGHQWREKVQRQKEKSKEMASPHNEL